MPQGWLARYVECQGPRPSPCSGEVCLTHKLLPSESIGCAGRGTIFVCFNRLDCISSTLSSALSTEQH